MYTRLNQRVAYIRQTVLEYPWTFGTGAVAFLVVYLLFDFREGGKASNLGTIKFGSAEGYIKNFGASWFWTMIVSDVVLAVLASLVITVAVATYRRPRSGTCAAYSVGAATVLAFATFGCPGCLLPLAGTVGATLFANALPLFGFEFKIVTMIVLLGGLFWQTRSSRLIEATEPAKSSH